MGRPPKPKRERHHMPRFILQALVENGLLEQYKERPPYQQNDYVGWIIKAKREETKQKRVNQMLDELAKGSVYMKMSWNTR